MEQENTREAIDIHERNCQIAGSVARQNELRTAIEEVIVADLEEGRVVSQSKLDVLGSVIRITKKANIDFICLTDLAKQKSEDPNATIGNWMRNRMTLEYLGLWEKLNNPNFNPLEFEGFRKQAGLNAFTLSPKRWIEATNAIGIITTAGRYGGTYAHSDIAFKFASWISVEFELYLVREFQRLKAEAQKLQGWSAKRELAKINYHIHADAIKENLIPPELDRRAASIVYASEADVLNMAMFGMTAQQWRDQHPGLKGNIRDYAGINELICLSNMENLNAVFIHDGMPQAERLLKLNRIASHQMRILQETTGRHLLAGDNEK